MAVNATKEVPVKRALGLSIFAVLLAIAPAALARRGTSSFAPCRKRTTVPAPNRRSSRIRAASFMEPRIPEARQRRHGFQGRRGQQLRRPARLQCRRRRRAPRQACPRAGGLSVRSDGSRRRAWSGCDLPTRQGRQQLLRAPQLRGGNFFWYRSLVQDSAGVLYGTNVFNPSNVFRIEADGSNYSVLHTFVNPGEGQTTSLMLASDGFLYGTTGDDAELGLSARQKRRQLRDDPHIHGRRGGRRASDGTVDGGDRRISVRHRVWWRAVFSRHDVQVAQGRLGVRGDPRLLESTEFTFPVFALTQVAGGLLYGPALAEQAAAGRFSA